MNAGVRVAGYVAGLAALFGVALAAGTMVGPVDDPAEAVGHEVGHGADHVDGHEDGATTSAVASSELPGGLMTSQDGYTLALDRPSEQAGRARTIAFTIEGPDGSPVTDYDVEHDRELHLIVVRRDFTGFQHVHPVRSADGTWRVDVDLTPGSWRVLADFAPAGAEPITLGTDLAVPGRVAPAADLPDSRTDTVDGYTVTLTGDLVAGQHSMLILSVSRRGEPVTDLEPYLGADGHLVALREGDLAYLHVHPGGEPGDGESEPGPGIDFRAEVPSVGGYHLYLDFRHDGVVRTAQFRLDAARSAP